MKNILSFISNMFRWWRKSTKPEIDQSSSNWANLQICSSHSRFPPVYIRWVKATSSPFYFTISLGYQMHCIKVTCMWRKMSSLQIHFSPAAHCRHSMKNIWELLKTFSYSNETNGITASSTLKKETAGETTWVRWIQPGIITEMLWFIHKEGHAEISTWYMIRNA